MKRNLEQNVHIKLENEIYYELEDRKEYKEQIRQYVEEQMIDSIIKEGSRLVHVGNVNGESVIGAGKMKRWCWIVEQLRESM